jgi:multidrug efflux pump subunit AcrA (membrane-fusion protein)
MKYFVSFLILLLALVAAFALYKTSPKTGKTVSKRPVPFVRTVPLEPARKEVFVEAFGTVVPAQRITLQSEVAGRIIDQNPELTPGGLIRQGDMVVQVDPADYELLVREYRAEMEEALFELELEQGKQVIAKREWELLEKEIEISSGKSLALREPHLRLVEAKLEKAKSRLAAAELALERTSIAAPFNVLVLEEFVDTGQLVGTQTTLATLVGTDRFWVQVSVPVGSLGRISFPGGAERHGSEAQVIFEPVSGQPVVRRGHVVRIMGDLDPEGRMARILVAIDDPLHLEAGSSPSGGPDGRGWSHVSMGAGRILLGSYVRVSIAAGFFDTVYSVPREALREGDVVWVKDSEGTLQIRPVRVVWRLKDDVLVDADLEPGDELIMSRLHAPLPGMAVQGVRDENPSPEQESPDATRE